MQNRSSTQREGEISNTFYLDGVRPQTRFVRIQRWIYASWGCFFLAQGVVRIFDNEEWWPAYVLTGILWLTTAIFFTRFFMGRYLQFDEDGIEARLSYRKQLKLRWDDLHSVEVSMFELVLITKNGQRIPFDLGSISYEEHKLVKPRFVEMTRLKGVQVIQKNSGAAQTSMP